MPGKATWGIQDVNVADKAILSVQDQETKNIERYISIVEEITAEGIVVSLPITRQVHAQAALREGTPVEVSIWKGYADHWFKSQVLKIEGSASPRLTLVRPVPEDILRIPRRKDFRVETKIATEIYAVGPEETEQVQALMVDMSASGCRLHTAKRLEPGTSVFLNFVLPLPLSRDTPKEARLVQRLPGGVKRANFLPVPKGAPRSRQYSYVIGVQFNRLEAAMETRMLHYVAFRQRQLIRQGMLKREGQIERGEEDR